MCIAGFDVVDIISMLLAVSVGLFASSLYYRYKVHAIQRKTQGVKTPPTNFIDHVDRIIDNTK